MKIAITGHTSGIGRALAQQYQERGHEIIGLSRRNGHDIKNTTLIADVIEPCDMFINNAQQGYDQTYLLFEMANRWANTPRKHIMVISTMMTQHPVCVLPGLDMNAYRIQKVALEEAVKQIRNQDRTLRLTVVRPGNIATSPDKTVPPAADVDHWARVLVDIFEMATPTLTIPDISLGPR
jgi:nucleoside-diphosphate-sugar epimerase